MSYTDEEIKARGLVLDDEGVVACPICGNQLRFNSGSPAVFHREDCTFGEQVTYMARAYQSINVTVTKDGSTAIIDGIEEET